MKLIIYAVDLNFKHLLLLLIAGSATFTVNAQSEYPYDFKYNGNPLVRTHGAADPSVHVWGDTVWMFCSQDHGEGYAGMDGYHAFSSTDLINWTDHGDVFNSTMLDTSRWGSTPDHWMWAPGAARKKDSNGVWTYYLYYPHNKSFVGQNWVTGVATAPSPEGPYTDRGPLLGGTMAMDPMVFIDDDGQAYIYANSAKVARLKPNMIELAEKPKDIEYDLYNKITERSQQFGEGSYMHKRNGKYYFSYSHLSDEFGSYYAMGDKPYSPFDFQGPMGPAPVAGQDHHSAIEFKGNWYYFYHVIVPEYPVVRDGQSRIACYDRMYYNNDGTIQLVVHTLGATKTLSIVASNGNLKFNPPGRSYKEGTEVEITVTSALGYKLESWGEDLSGSENPIKIIMDGDKTVTTNFITIPTYKLTTSALNGKILLDPPVGEYNPGDEVTLTAVDDFGYDFKSWSGDLSGSENPAKITISTNIKIEANFVSVPTYTLKTKASNGSVTLDPPGGIYEEGTVVSVKALRDFGYNFSSWSGDASGTVNPVLVSMDANKTVSAKFDYFGAGTLIFATNCGGDSLKAEDGIVYTKDNGYNGGGNYSGYGEISGTEDDDLFLTERFGGNFSYDIKMPNDEYEVTLLFAETFHGKKSSRIFNVEIENEKVISNLDIADKVGKNAAYEETFNVKVKDGELNIVFTTVKDNAKVSAIHVIKR